jgi:hypothetical protein
LDQSDDYDRVDKITRKILSGQSVSEAEYRYNVMFNLTAMTQLLWELSSQRNHRSNLSKEVPARKETDPPNLGRIGGFRIWSRKLLPLLTSLAGFLAGIGIGYLLP